MLQYSGISTHEETNPAQRLCHELRGASIAGALDPSARPHRWTITACPTGSIWRKTLERGRFDGLFLADVLGVYDVYGTSPDAALRNAAQTPANEPLMLIPAMAAVTKHLGFGVTSNLSFEPPYPFARRMSTLDHLTEGRIGWNVVTGYLDSAARGAGKDKQTAHDDRYEVADEYMEVVYKLWEGSWEDEAVLRDRARGIFADPVEGASRHA